MPNTRDFSIVIPTLNEEDYIGKLLDSILIQTVLPKEIIIVDAESKDRTIEEIRKRKLNFPNLYFFQIAIYTIARQRNFGVTQSETEHILFLDADMMLKQPDALEKYMMEVAEKKPDLAAAITYPLSNDWRDLAYFSFITFITRLVQPFWPIVTTQNLYVRKEFFESLGGFDEQVRVAEDMEFVQRAIKKKGHFVFLAKPRIYTSVRRFVKEGRIRFVFKMLTSFALIQLVGFRRNKVEYEFGNFKEPKK